MNHCPLGSQGARGQLSTGPSGPLDFAAADRKEIFQPNFSYGVFLVPPAMGRLMRWDLSGQCDGEIGVGLAVGRCGRFASRESCLLAAADFVLFFLEAWGEDVVFRRTDCPLNNVSNRLFLHFLEAVTILGMDDAAPFDIESSRNLTRAANESHCP